MKIPADVLCLVLGRPELRYAAGFLNVVFCMKYQEFNPNTLKINSHCMVKTSIIR